jgi:hypothetical protein
MTTETAELWLADPNRYPLEAAEQIARRLQEATQRLPKVARTTVAQCWAYRRDALAEALSLVLSESWSDNPAGPVPPNAQELIELAGAGRLVAETQPIVDDVLGLRAHVQDHPNVDYELGVGDGVLITWGHPFAGARGLIERELPNSEGTWAVRLRNGSGTVAVRPKFLRADPYLPQEVGR